ncbi:type II toxin-antitoxin system RelE/ParE family toxin [Rhodanobacter lindaniclasticus]
MARIELAPEVGEDFQRILDHLASHQAADITGRLHEIVAAIDVLATNPVIGQPGSNGKRELVIGKASHGYVALYRYVESLDFVFVLVVRARREAGFTR